MHCVGGRYKCVDVQIASSRRALAGVLYSAVQQHCTVLSQTQYTSPLGPAEAVITSPVFVSVSRVPIPSRAPASTPSGARTPPRQ